MIDITHSRRNWTLLGEALLEVGCPKGWCVMTGFTVHSLPCFQQQHAGSGCPDINSAEGQLQAIAYDLLMSFSSRLPSWHTHLLASSPALVIDSILSHYHHYLWADFMAGARWTLAPDLRWTLELPSMVMIRLYYSGCSWPGPCP